jgi:hypothetical protein
MYGECRKMYTDCPSQWDVLHCPRAGKRTKKLYLIGAEATLYKELIQFLVYACKSFKFDQRGFLEAEIE